MKKNWNQSEVDFILKERHHYRYKLMLSFRIHTHMHTKDEKQTNKQTQKIHR